MTREKVIVVAETAVYDWVNDLYGQRWDTQREVSSVDELWVGINDGSLSGESTVIIFADSYFDSSGINNDFEDAVATLAPHACVMILNYRENERAIIADRIQQSIDGSGVNYPFWFVGVESATEDINNAYQQWIDSEDTAGQDPHVVNYDEASFDDIEEAAQDIANSNSSRGMVISVTSSKGGTGKSSLGILLASQLALGSQKAVKNGKAKKPISVCLVDMDTRDGQVGWLVGVTSPTILNIRTTGSWEQDVISRNLVDPKHGGFKVLLAPKQARTALDISPEFYRNVVLQLRNMFDVVILDTSVNYLDVLLGEVCYGLSDRILFVAELGISAVLGFPRWFKEVTSSREEGGNEIDPDIISLVVNKFVHNVGMGAEKLRLAFAATEVWATVPALPREFLLLANMNHISRLLRREDIGNIIFNLAVNFVPGYPLEPLVEANELSQANMEMQEPRDVPRRSEKSREIAVKARPAKRRGFFSR